MPDSKPPENQAPNSGLELDTSKRTSSPNLVRSAARAQPLAPLVQPKKLTKERLREGATDTLLNSVSILAEMMEDFRQSDRFFKYKAFVIAAWLFLTVSTFAVACPSRGPTNEIDAHLIMSGEENAPIYMVKNDSEDVWQNVVVTVNGGYKATLTQVDANGGSLTLSPVVLFNSNGDPAPRGYRITDIEVKVDDPKANVRLLQGGRRLMP